MIAGMNLVKKYRLKRCRLARLSSIFDFYLRHIDSGSLAEDILFQPQAGFHLRLI